MPEQDRRDPVAEDEVEARVLMPETRHRGRSVKTYEFAVVLPFLLWELHEVLHHGALFNRPMLLLWIAAIALVDLLPVPTGSGLHFSLSFPLQMAVALIYPPPVAAMAAFLGTSDHRELRGELPVLKAMFIRGQIGVSVLVESLLFHHFTEIGGRWWAVGPVVLAATVAGYLVNAALVAYYFHLESRESVMTVFKEMHVGVFAEFVLSYMGLALFSVLVATSFVGAGPTSIVVFIAPLVFARQMFQRTHSLQVATEDLARREAEKEYQSLHDSLTDLPNRALFMRELNEAVEEAVRRRTRVAVMIMDLDRFKEVNDTLGHHYGDLLLQQIGPRLTGVLREGDVLARLGGDEFGILLPNLPSEDVAMRIAGRLVQELEDPLSVEGIALDVSASLGVALFPQHSEDVETLLRRADVAMYAAKAAGSGHEIYDRAFDQHKPEHLSLIAQVRPAMEAEEFVLHFQPKLNIADGSVAGVEALVRWQHPERGLVFPDDFIPMVEHTVLLRPLTLYVLDAALRQWQSWKEAGLDIRVSVNLSARNLLDLELPEQVAEALQRWNAQPDVLVLELTESFIMSDPVRSIGVMDRLAGLGIELSIDDFGTGYSSLSYLQRLPIKELKIDKSFVMAMDTRPNDAMIVNVTVALGQNLGLRVVAEGVENQATWEMLNALGCDVAQGYLLSKPLPAAEATAWMLERPHRSVERGEGDAAPHEQRLATL